MPTLTGIHHLALSVTDLERSVKWYQEVLGLVELMRGRDDDIGVTYAIQVGTDAPMAIGLRQFDATDEGARFSHLNPGMDHVALQVADRDELMAWEQRLRATDATFTPATEHAIGEVVVVRDPDDIQIELWLAKV